MVATSVSPAAKRWPPMRQSRWPGAGGRTPREVLYSERANRLRSPTAQAAQWLAPQACSMVQFASVKCPKSPCPPNCTRGARFKRQRFQPTPDATGQSGWMLAGGSMLPHPADLPAFD